MSWPRQVCVGLGSKVRAAKWASLVQANLHCMWQDWRAENYPANAAIIIDTVPPHQPNPVQATIDTAPPYMRKPSSRLSAMMLPHNRGSNGNEEMTWMVMSRGSNDGGACSGCRGALDGACL